MTILEQAKGTDDLATITSVGLSAYLSADVAHHPFGHAAACKLLGGQVLLVTSQLVQCTVTGTAVDLAGPAASLCLGVSAYLAARLLRVLSPTEQLLLSLIAAFNLFWFNLQLVYSALSQTDDWAWAMHEFHMVSSARYCLALAGALGYLFSVKIVAGAVTAYARPKKRIRRICFVTWASAGVVALLTALLDHNPDQALLNALPQALGLSLGLLFIPRNASGLSADQTVAPTIRCSPFWNGATILSAVASCLFLGPGFSSNCA